MFTEEDLAAYEREKEELGIVDDDEDDDEQEYVDVPYFEPKEMVITAGAKHADAPMVPVDEARASITAAAVNEAKRSEQETLAEIKRIEARLAELEAQQAEGRFVDDDGTEYVFDQDEIAAADHEDEEDGEKEQDGDDDAEVDEANAEVEMDEVELEKAQAEEELRAAEDEAGEVEAKNAEIAFEA